MALDALSLIVVGACSGFGSALGNYVFSKHLIERMERIKNGQKEPEKRTFIKDLKALAEYLAGDFR